MYAFILTLYPDESAQVFALFAFAQTIFTSSAFFYSPHVSLRWHLSILLVAALIGSVGFVAAERTGAKRLREARDEPVEADDDDERAEASASPRPLLSASNTNVAFPLIIQHMPPSTAVHQPCERKRVTINTALSRIVSVN